jgi:hypothetical protein
MRYNTSVILAFLSVLFLNSCETDGLLGEYVSIGKFANRTTAETEALKTLVNKFASLPASGFYKVKYEFDDAQLPPQTSGHDHAIWYDKANNQLAVEFDIFSGTSCRWNDADQESLQKIIDSKLGLEAANDLATPASKEQDCFK